MEEINVTSTASQAEHTPYKNIVAQLTATEIISLTNLRDFSIIDGILFTACAT